MSAIDTLAATFEEMKPGEHYCFDHCTVTIMDSPLCGRYKIVGQLASQVRFTDSATAALDAVDDFQDHPMPDALDDRHKALLDASKRCYALRNAAEHYHDFDKANSYHEIGDVYFEQARALKAEWDT